MGHRAKQTSSHRHPNNVTSPRGLHARDTRGAWDIDREVYTSKPIFLKYFLWESQKMIPEQYFFVFYIEWRIKNKIVNYFKFKRRSAVCILAYDATPWCFFTVSNAKRFWHFIKIEMSTIWTTWPGELSLTAHEYTRFIIPCQSIPIRERLRS